MQKNLEDTLLNVQLIIAEFTGIAPEGIHLDTLLCEDLGIAGDDDLELFELIDDNFAIDWKNLDIGIHFGNEGLGFPVPWLLKGNCCLYESQPCSVRDIVNAIETGVWKGTERIELSQSEQKKIYILSTIQTFIPISIFAIVLIKVLI